MTNSQDVESPQWPEQLLPELYDQLLGTAHHEAGHAVVSYVCGFTVKSISIEPSLLTEDDRSILECETDNLVAAGHVDVEHGAVIVDGQIRDTDSLKLWTMYMFAGGLAQLKVSPGGISKVAIKHDCRCIAICAIHLLGKKAAGPWVRAVFKETESLVNRDDVREAIDATANLLLSHGTITASQFLSVASVARRRVSNCCSNNENENGKKKNESGTPTVDQDASQI